MRQMWEEVARRVEAVGGTVQLCHTVTGIATEGDKAVSVTVRDGRTGETSQVEADYVFSTMPVKHLVAAIEPAAEDYHEEIQQPADEATASRDEDSVQADL